MSAPKSFGEHYAWVLSQDPAPSTSHGFIQWKGSNVCADLRCACGHRGHFDGDFLYYWRCSSCGRVHAMSPYVKAIELPSDQRAYVESERSDLVQEDQS